MSSDERRRWNDKYAAGEHATETPSRLLTALDPLLPRSGRAIDVAGGTGRHAIWLAQRGLDVTLADISDVALRLASSRADQSAVKIKALQIDMEHEPFPAGPWDLIVTVHYLYRPLLCELTASLAPRGVLVVIQPTRTNLQRHAKPSERFLLEDGELLQLVSGLDIIHYEEGWLGEGRHEAVLVTRQP